MVFLLFVFICFRGFLRGGDGVFCCCFFFFVFFFFVFFFFLGGGGSAYSLIIAMVTKHTTWKQSQNKISNFKCNPRVSTHLPVHFRKCLWNYSHWLHTIHPKNCVHVLRYFGVWYGLILPIFSWVLYCDWDNHVIMYSVSCNDSIVIFCHNWKTQTKNIYFVILYQHIIQIYYVCIIIYLQNNSQFCLP